MSNPTILSIPSPLDEIYLPILELHKVRLFVKRDDLIHKEISGNKWRKLKFNIEESINQGHSTILTYGGPYSNHIYATAAAAKLFGLQSIGVIRGNYFKEQSHTLKFAQDCGMKLKILSKADFDKREEDWLKKQLQSEFGAFYDIPDGGANDLGAKGCEEIVAEIKIEFDAITVPCGTATTLKGIAKVLPKGKLALGFPALKNSSTLEKSLQNTFLDNWKLIDSYHFGGYAKLNDNLRKFKENFHHQTGIELDLVYTSKMMFGLIDLIGKGYFSAGTTLVAVHTGGLQGNLSLET